MSTSIIALIVVLGVLIFFHELGHFLVARLFGVGVERFSLGFGPRLVGKTIGITDYRISAIPLGGYVKMVGEEPDAELDPEKIPLSFTHKHVFKRILIVAAGPASNLLLAVVIFFGFFVFSGVEDVTPVIRNIETDGPAYSAGLQKGDRIVSINGMPVESWYDIDKAMDRNEDRVLDIRAQRGATLVDARVAPERKTGKNLFNDEVTYYGIGIFGYPDRAAVVGSVTAGSPAEKGGLKKGDRVVSINGRSIENWQAMSESIAASEGKPLEVKTLRGETTLELTLKPDLQEVKNALGQTETRYLIGVSSAGVDIPEADKFVKRLNPLAAFEESLHRTWFVVEISVVGVVKIIKGAIPKDNLGGPIMIAQMAGEQAKAGVGKLIQFIAFISINLAILNFLPIPVLDGGHLLFFFIEAVIRRPVGVRVREIAQQAGMFALLLLMIFVFYNDIRRIVQG